MHKKLAYLFVWLLALVLILPAGSVLANTADDVVGKWVTEGGKSHVQISKQGSQYIGKLVWLKEPNRDGKPKTDSKNPDKALQARPLVGLLLLSGFSFKGGEWVDGKIYNPEDGKTYSCKMKLKDKNTLEVRGYVMNPALGKTQVWKRS